MYPVMRCTLSRSYRVRCDECTGPTPSGREGGGLIYPLRALPSLSRPASDLLLYGLRLFGHRACQRPKLVPRIMELIDQGHNDWQAGVVETHAVVQVAGQRHTRL